MEPIKKLPVYKLRISDNDNNSLVVDYIASNRNTPLKIKGGVVGGRYFGAEQIDALAKVPPRDVLLSQMLGAFNSPISGLVYTLQGVISNFVYTLKAIEEKKAAA